MLTRPGPEASTHTQEKYSSLLQTLADSMGMTSPCVVTKSSCFWCRRTQSMNKRSSPARTPAGLCSWLQAQCRVQQTLSALQEAVPGAPDLPGQVSSNPNLRRPILLAAVSENKCFSYEGSVCRTRKQANHTAGATITMGRRGAREGLLPSLYLRSTCNFRDTHTHTHKRKMRTCGQMQPSRALPLRRQAVQKDGDTDPSVCGCGQHHTCLRAKDTCAGAQTHQSACGLSMPASFWHGGCSLSLKPCHAEEVFRACLGPVHMLSGHCRAASGSKRSASTLCGQHRHTRPGQSPNTGRCKSPSPPKAEKQIMGNGAQQQSPLAQLR